MTTAPATTAALPPRINGFVRRSDGALTTWVDGDARFQRDGGLSPPSAAVETPNRIVVHPARPARAGQNVPPR